MFNNLDMRDYEKIVQERHFLERGAKVQVNMELKKYCEADAFCIMLTKFYGSMFEFTLSGNIDKIKKQVTLVTPLADINFNERYMIDNCYLNFFIDYSDLAHPLIDLYLSGDFIGEV